MLKKRLIFTLLYCDGWFMLRRNFRLQRVGNLKWLQTNYNFSYISYFIDELVVLDVSRNKKDQQLFCEVIKELAHFCFAPISVGGGVASIEGAWSLLRSGADKIVVNTSLYENSSLIEELAKNFGQQCLVASIDFKKNSQGSYTVLKRNGSSIVEGDAAKLVNWVANCNIGELYLNSIDHDGTGQGLNFDLLNLLPKNNLKPVILSGGVGNSMHIRLGLEESRVDAVSTANLLNFVGDSLKRARQYLVESGVSLPHWNFERFEEFLKNNARQI